MFTILALKIVLNIRNLHSSWDGIWSLSFGNIEATDLVRAWEKRMKKELHREPARARPVNQLGPAGPFSSCWAGNAGHGKPGRIQTKSFQHSIKKKCAKFACHANRTADTPRNRVQWADLAFPPSSLYII